MFRGSVIATGDTSFLHDAKVLAYAGIGNPERFFETVRGLGATIVEYRVYQDHHTLLPVEAQDLLEVAAERQLKLVTTEKDWVRLSSNRPELAQLREQSVAVPIAMTFSEQHSHQLESWVMACLCGPTTRS